MSPDNVVKNLHSSVNHKGTNLESALIAARGKTLGFCFLSAQYTANLFQVCNDTLETATEPRPAAPCSRVVHHLQSKCELKRTKEVLELKPYIFTDSIFLR